MTKTRKRKTYPTMLRRGVWTIHCFFTVHARPEGLASFFEFVKEREKVVRQAHGIEIGIRRFGPNPPNTYNDHCYLSATGRDDSLLAFYDEKESWESMVDDCCLLTWDMPEGPYWANEFIRHTVTADWPRHAGAAGSPEAGSILVRLAQK